MDRIICLMRRRSPSTCLTRKNTCGVPPAAAATILAAVLALVAGPAGSPAQAADRQEQAGPRAARAAEPNVALQSLPPVGDEHQPEARVPSHPDWTYYLKLDAGLQQYTSPYSGERIFTEKDSYRWFYFRSDDPANPFALFRDDDGDETEMWALDESVRLQPPPASGEVRYRIYACLRDERPEWTMYQTTPGLTVASGEIVFLP